MITIEESEGWVVFVFDENIASGSIEFAPFKFEQLTSDSPSSSHGSYIYTREYYPFYWYLRRNDFHRALSDSNLYTHSGIYRKTYCLTTRSLQLSQSTWYFNRVPSTFLESWKKNSREFIWMTPGIILWRIGVTKDLLDSSTGEILIMHGHRPEATCKPTYMPVLRHQMALPLLISDHHLVI